MITIYSIVARTMKFIEQQQGSLRRLADQHELVVVNNDHGAARANITACCRVLGIKCLEVPGPSPSDYSFAHGWGLNYAWRRARGVAALIDMDVFLLKPYSIPHKLRQRPVAGIEQIRGEIRYPWPGLVFFDKDRLPLSSSVNWNPWQGRYDTGGGMGEHLKARGLDFAGLSEEYVKHPDDADMNCSLIDGAWLHYRDGSDWTGKGPDYHARKLAWVKGMFEL